MFEDMEGASMILSLVLPRSSLNRIISDTLVQVQHAYHLIRSYQGWWMAAERNLDERTPVHALYQIVT